MRARISWHSALHLRWALGLALAATPAVPARGLTIHATIDSSITSRANSPAIQTAIDDAIGTIESLLADPIEVSIDFRYATTDPDGVTPLALRRAPQRAEASPPQSRLGSNPPVRFPRGNPRVAATTTEKVACTALEPLRRVRAAAVGGPYPPGSITPDIAPLW